jgi:hypothetical protein
MRTLAATLAMLAVLAPGMAEAQAISPAETLLFETDHLAKTKAPATLEYAFRKDSNVEPAYSDKVRLELATVNGKLSATLHFLSGEHKQEVPALEEAHGNPVLLGFLEHDIAEMKRLTGGSTSYFRKRIRMALAEGAEVSRQAVTYQGKTLQAQTVRIQPYLNDPMHARFEKYLHKIYTFVLSEQVPGGVYQLRTSIGKPETVRTSGKPAATPVIDETLTLISVTPGKP